MQLARVIGRVVATQRVAGLEDTTLQWVQPLDEQGEPSGRALVACAVIASGAQLAKLARQPGRIFA